MNKKHVILLIAFIGIAATAFAQSSKAKEAYNRGNAALKVKNYDQAIVEYTEAIRLSSKYAEAYNNRGLAYYNKQDYDRAIADYDQAIKLEPKNADAYNNRGIAYRNKDDYDRAIADYDQAIKLEPTASRYNNRGLAYANKKDYDRAIVDYTEAIKLEPTAARYNNRGLAYYNKQDYDRAIADYEAVLRLAPNHANAKKSLEEAYDQAIKLEPTASRYFYRGVAYDNKGDYDRAIADYTEAIKLEPTTARYFNRGLAYANKGDYDRAIADYEQVIKLDANYISAYYYRGIAYYNKKDYDRAIADYEAVLRIDPNHANAKNNIANAQKQYQSVLTAEKRKQEAEEKQKKEAEDLKKRQQVKEQIQKIVRFDGAYVLVNQRGISAIRFDDKRLENVITAWLVESLQDTKVFNLSLGLNNNTIYDQFKNNFTPSNDKNTLRVGYGSNNTETYVFRPFSPVVGKTFVRLNGGGNTFAYQFLNSSQYNTLGSNGRVNGGSSSTERTYEYSAKGFFREKTFLGEIVFRTGDFMFNWLFQVGPFLVLDGTVWQEN